MSKDYTADSIAFPLCIVEGPAPPMIAGRFYDASTHGIGNLEFGTTAMVANVFAAIPIFIPRTSAFDRIGLEVTTAGAGGSTARVGIYRDSNGAPGQIVAGSDAGALATDAVAVVESSISVSLTPGWYWLANLFSATPTCRAFITSTPPKRVGYTVNTNPTTINSLAVSGAFPFGAMPTNAPATDLSSTGAHFCRVFLRAA